MAGYVLLNVEVTDQDAFADFRDRFPAVVDSYSGKYLIRGGDTEVVQGDWTPHRLVLIEFDSVQQAQSFWNDPEHSKLRAALDKCANTTAGVIADGA